MNFQNNKTEQEKFEERHNLTGFFELLLKIDMRVNPHLYENKGNSNNSNQI